MAKFLDYATGLPALWAKIKGIIPTKTSDLTNDSGFVTSSDVDVFVITISGNANNGYTSDKTYVEIKAAYDSGKKCVAKYTYGTTQTWFFILVNYNSSLNAFYFSHPVVVNSTQITVHGLTINSQNTVTIQFNTVKVELSVSQLKDVTISSPSDGQVLTYDGTSSKWINGDGKEVYNFNIFTNVANMDVTYDDVYAAHKANKLVRAINEPFCYYLTNANSYGMSFIGYNANRNEIVKWNWKKSNNIITMEKIGVINTSTSSPTNGQVLTYNSSTSQWVNADPTGSTYSLSLSGSTITLTGSDGSTSSINLPIYDGSVTEVWTGGTY